MQTLHQLFERFKDDFAHSRKGEERIQWFIYTILAIIFPFASSKTSNLLRCLKIIFGFTYINPKTGKKIFSCHRFFDHAAKQNQSKYPWAQNIVSAGLLAKDFVMKTSSIIDRLTSSSYSLFINNWTAFTLRDGPANITYADFLV